MAQQPQITDEDLNAIASTSSSVTSVKKSFAAWLSDGRAKKHSPEVYLSCLDRASAYFISRKITSVELWQHLNFEVFKNVYSRAINDKLFRVTERKTYTAFVDVGHEFLRFLKSKPSFSRATSKETEISTHVTEELTIKEAVIKVLELSQNGMTFKEIYDKIIEEHLYRFSAQNPIKVMQIEIDRACENSNYAVRASKNCFRFERNQQHEKVYFLLSTSPTNEIPQPRITASDPARSKQICNEQSRIEVWNEAIKRQFEAWMEVEKYSSATIRNYCSSTKRTTQNFELLMTAAIRESATLPETVLKFVGLLNLDSGFISANTAAHNQLSAALAAFTRFVDSSLSNNTLATDAKAVTLVDENMKASILTILEEHYPNGIRPNSVIDINKLKSYCREATIEETVSFDLDMPALLKEVGIQHGEKIFAISLAGKKQLEEAIINLIAKGNRLFFYSEFYETHMDLLQKMHIFSSELLRTVFVKLLPSLFYSRNYFSTTSDVSAESEVLRCFDLAVCLSYEQLKHILPYVPLDRIKQVLAQNNDFIWVTKGEYTHKSKLEIDFNEWSATEKKISAGIAEHGYVSLASLDVSNTLELNPELSETAVKNGLFLNCLANSYERRGNIITTKDAVLNSAAVFKDYCLSHNRLSLSELLQLEKEIYGTNNSQALFAAYNTMVRVDKDIFVDDGAINFDIEATDNALALFVHSDFIPLRSVTSFTSFPYIDGYSWNWFLLESYCKRFSKQFGFQSLSVSSRNVGAIFRKSAGFADYTAVLMTAVANEDIRLDEKEVSDFLFDNGYVARRTGVISDVIAQARILREMRA